MIEVIIFISIAVGLLLKERVWFLYVEVNSFYEYHLEIFDRAPINCKPNTTGPTGIIYTAQITFFRRDTELLSMA